MSAPRKFYRSKGTQSLLRTKAEKDLALLLWKCDEGHLHLFLMSAESGIPAIREHSVEIGKERHHGGVVEIREKWDFRAAAGQLRVARVTAFFGLDGFPINLSLELWESFRFLGRTWRTKKINVASFSKFELQPATPAGVLGAMIPINFGDVLGKEATPHLPKGDA